MKSRCEKFYKLLTKMFGENYVNFMVRPVWDKDSLKFVDHSENIEAFIKKNRFENGNKPCDFCEPTFKEKPSGNITIYNNRIIEFPSWSPKSPLNFQGTEPAKKLLLIGIDPGPNIRMDIHTAYELGIFNINEKGGYELEKYKKIIQNIEDDKIRSELNFQLNRTKQTRFWKYLMSLFSNDSDYVLNNIYITDACKCLDKDNEEVFEDCCNIYLYQEIRLINPQLIIIQGNRTYDKLAEIYEIKDEKVPHEHFISDNFPKHGRLIISSQKGEAKSYIC